MAKIAHYRPQQFYQVQATQALIAAATVRQASDAAVVAETVTNIEGLGETLEQVQELANQANLTLQTVDQTLVDYGQRIQTLEAM